MKEENLKTVYNEVNELHKHQQQGIDLMYNKLNWILVSDIVFLAGLYANHCPNVFVVILVSISAIVALLSFNTKKYKHTAKISSQLDGVENEHFLESLIEKKREAFIANDSRNKELAELLQYSQWLLVGAIIAQFLTLIF